MSIGFNLEIYSFAVQHDVEPPLLAVNLRPLEVNLRTEPPIGDENLFSGQFDSVGHGIHVVAAVDEPGTRTFTPDGRVAAKSVGADKFRS